MLQTWNLIDRNFEFFKFHTEVNGMGFSFDPGSSITINGKRHIIEQSYFYLKSNKEIYNSDFEIRNFTSGNLFENDNPVSNLFISDNFLHFVYNNDGKNILDIRGISRYKNNINKFGGIRLNNDVYSAKDLAHLSKRISENYTNRTGNTIDAIRLSSPYTGKEGSYGGESFASAFARHANVNTIGFDGDVIAAIPNSKGLAFSHSSEINAQLIQSQPYPMKAVGMYSGEARRSSTGRWTQANRALQFSPTGRRAALNNINEIVEFM